jgi:hypothetical protein
MATEEDSSSDPGDGLPDGPSGDPTGKSYFGPPKEPCLCGCLHCGRTFMSDGIWFQEVVRNGVVVDGKWCCPTPNCDGIGYTFDIYPVDPDHPDNEGWTHDDGDEEYEWDEEDDDVTGEAKTPGEPKPYDPAEPEYAALDEMDEDIEGEEWKLGLKPGDPRPETDYESESRKRWEEEQARYDMPDERPRVIDKTGEPEPPPMQFGDDGVPF